MRAYWGLLLLIWLIGGTEAARAQGLQCLGGNKVTYKTCGPCPGAYQTRAQAMCTQPTDLYGNGCGSITCETCTCQGTPSGVGGWGDIPVVTGDPEVKRDPPPRVLPPNDTSPTPILRGGDLTRAGFPNPNPYHSSEQAKCFSLHGWKFEDDPSSEIFKVTIRNSCNACITGSFLVHNRHQQFASTGPNRHASESYTFRPGEYAEIFYRVHNRMIWMSSELYYQLYESHFVQCPSSGGTPVVR